MESASQRNWGCALPGVFDGALFLENADALRSNAQLRPRLIQITPLMLWNRQLKLPATNSNSVDLTALLALLQPLDLTSDTRLRGG
jgi:hypothetical protein